MRLKTNSPTPCAESREQRLGFFHSAFLRLPSENPAENAETICGTEAACAMPATTRVPTARARIVYRT